MTHHHKTILGNFLLVVFLLAACGHQQDTPFDPRDTVQVPEGYSGEDSIAYIENMVIQSPISVTDLLNLAEVHSIDSWMDDWLEYNPRKLTHRDSCAMRLANRFMRMHHLVDMNGDAMDKLQWAEATNIIIDSFCAQVPHMERDSAIYEIQRLFDDYSPLSQLDMNMACYIMSSVDYYQTIDTYRRLLSKVPDNLKALIQEEYKAWVDLNEARYVFWRDVWYTQTWYSMKPMEIEGYYENLSQNRRAELAIEQDIILKGIPYNQKGKTVTTKQWEQWLKEHSRPEDYDDVISWNGTYENMTSDSTVAACITAMKQTFSRWVAARQALAAALPEDRGIAYDNLTADIHSRIVGKLPAIIPLYDSSWEEE